MESLCSSLKLISLHSNLHLLWTRNVCGYFSALPWEINKFFNIIIKKIIMIFFSPGKNWKRQCRRDEKDHLARAW